MRNNKRVNFMEGEEGRLMFERPPPNSYTCNPPPGQAAKYAPKSFMEPIK